MHRKAATAALVALGLIFVCVGSMSAKPTRTINRAAARRLIVASPELRSSRERPAHHAASLRASENRRETRNARVSRRTLVSEREPSRESSRLQAHSHLRTPSQERSFAAESAIAAADRRTHPSPRLETRTSRSRRAHSIVVSTRSSRRRIRDFDARQSRPTQDEDATADGAPVNSAVLANVGGTLRSVTGTPLKSIEEEAATPVLLPPLRVSSLYDSRGRLIVPPPLYGSREILIHQNEMANRDGLDRVQNDADLLDLRRQKKLVPLPESDALRVDYRLPEDRRFSRPWTAAFLTVIATDFYAAFHVPLQVDSAVRTVEVQQHLLRINGNAAPVAGDTASPHLTGQAVDIAKAGLTRTQIAWMRTYLEPLIEVGKIDVEEEFQQSCFHISVYRNFLPIAPARLSVAEGQPATDTLPERPIE